MNLRANNSSGDLGATLSAIEKLNLNGSDGERKRPTPAGSGAGAAVANVRAQVERQERGETRCRRQPDEEHDHAEPVERDQTPAQSINYDNRFLSCRSLAAPVIIAAY